MRLFLNIIQTIGMAVPLVGVGALIRKEQNHTSLYLMLTNIGCLLINGSYMLLLQSQTPREALAAMKLEYLGNVFFYLFFAMFLLSYLKIKRGWILLFPWLGLDIANLFCLCPECGGGSKLCMLPPGQGSCFSPYISAGRSG